jgi:hypothetical protein
MTLRGQFHKDRNAYISAQEPGIFHCHHYNTYLQAVIEDTQSYLDVSPILIESAQEVANTQFSSFFQTEKLDVDERKKVAEEYFSFCGFGIIDLKFINQDGGTTQSLSDHYATGWKSKFGVRPADQKGVSFFTLGYIIGAIEAIYDLPLGTLTGEQTACMAKGDSTSNFKLEKKNKTDLAISPKEGEFQTANLPKPEDTNVDYQGIREALINMPLQGSEKEGLIDAFGVLLTRMYSNYYCLISYKFLKLFEEKMGEDGIAMACELLIEAGHVCAFNTFGGIMQSEEWNGLIKPTLQSKTDWVHGVVAVVNSLGWGFWEIEELIPNEKLVMKITSGYEANSYISKYGKSKFPISFLANGGSAGIMNLVYNTILSDEPVTLDESYYKKLRNMSNVFTAEQTKCRANGDDHDVFVVTKTN